MIHPHFMKSDSVFMYICYSEKPCPEIFRKCSNLLSIGSLSDLLETHFIDKEQLTRSKQSTIETKGGIRYI